MARLADWLEEHPIVPYIRQSDYAVRKPWIVPTRRLLDYLLIYVQEGRLVVRTEEETVEATGGGFVLLQPGTVHELRGTTNTITPFAHLDLFYSADRSSRFPTKPGQIDLSDYAHLMQPRLNDIEGVRLPLCVKPAEPIRFRDTMLRMVRAWLEGGPLGRLEAQALATELALALLRQYAEPIAATDDPIASLNWITSYCSFHLAEPLSVRDMARRAHLSPSRFNVVFREQFGMTPHQYLLSLRIKHARELLETTGYDLHAIAEYCGFADVHHLSKTFRKSLGMPPGAYRREHAGGMEGAEAAVSGDEAANVAAARFAQREQARPGPRRSDDARRGNSHIPLLDA